MPPIEVGHGGPPLGGGPARRALAVVRRADGDADGVDHGRERAAHGGGLRGRFGCARSRRGRDARASSASTRPSPRLLTAGGPRLLAVRADRHDLGPGRHVRGDARRRGRALPSGRGRLLFVPERQRDGRRRVRLPRRGADEHVERRARGDLPQQPRAQAGRRARHRRVHAARGALLWDSDQRVCAVRERRGDGRARPLLPRGEPVRHDEQRGDQHERGRRRVARGVCARRDGRRGDRARRRGRARGRGRARLGAQLRRPRVRLGRALAGRRVGRGRRAARRARGARARERSGRRRGRRGVGQRLEPRRRVRRARREGAAGPRAGRAARARVARARADRGREPDGRAVRGRARRARALGERERRGAGVPALVLRRDRGRDGLRLRPGRARRGRRRRRRVLPRVAAARELLEPLHPLLDARLPLRGVWLQHALVVVERRGVQAADDRRAAARQLVGRVRPAARERRQVPRVLLRRGRRPARALELRDRRLRRGALPVRGQRLERACRG